MEYRLEKLNNEGEFALHQNKHSPSFFGILARHGVEIQWVMKYQGDVIVDGKRMNKEQAIKLLKAKHDAINKEEAKQLLLFVESKGVLL